MGGGTTEFFLRHGLVGDGLDDVGAGHEHVARVLDHVDEVGHRRGIDRAAGAGPHDHGNLRYSARGLDIAPEHVRIAAERGDALLDAGPAGIVETDQRSAVLHSQIHDLADLLGMRFAQRAAKHGEILAEHIDHPAFDGAPAADHAIAGDDGLGHAEFGRTVSNEHIVFFEAAGIEQYFQPLAGSQLALAVLGVDALLPAAQTCLGAPVFERSNDFLHRRVSLVVAPT